jgi:hypothetical protein
MKITLTKTFIWLTIFSIAMGFLETAVVIYLRIIYYPDGFSFPLHPIGKDIVITELFREVATMIMLIGIATLAGKNAVQRFAFFLFSFAVWDIFYYVFLYVLIGWPQSLMTWDILFLIPVPWVGPVLSPLIITFLMIALAGIMVFFDNKGIKSPVNLKEWLLFITGSIIVVITWTWDYCNYIIINNPNTSIWSLSSKEALFEAGQKYVPQSFNWLLFTVGALVILIAISFYYLRNRTRERR